MKRLNRETGVLVSGILGLYFALYLTGCGDPPSTPVEQRGDIAVTAYLPDSSLADSIRIELDGDSLGYFPNPDTLHDILAGTHHIEVFYQDEVAPGTFVPYFQVDSVYVTSGTPCNTSLYLVAVVSPAPDFTLYDIQGNLVSMGGLAGQVCLLYFFSYT